MNLALEKYAMPDAIQTGAGLWGTISAGIVAALAILYTLWGKLNVSRTEADVDSDTLKLVGAAVEHWRNLYEVAQGQVLSERALREAAERRGAAAVAQVEDLRGEVATLRREIERLTAMVKTMTGGV